MNLCTTLYSKKSKQESFRYFCSLLFFISIITFQTTVCADLKKHSAQEYRDLGYEAHQKGDFNEALKYYSMAVSMGYSSPVLYNDMGILHEQTGFPDRAEDFYLKAVALDEAYLPAYGNLAYFYLEKNKKPLAYKYFQIRFDLGHPDDPWTEKAKDEILKIYPDFKKVLAERAAKDLEEEVIKQNEIEFYRRMKRSSEHFKRGQKFYLQQKYAQAMGEYSHALRLTPNNPKVYKAIQETELKLTEENIKMGTSEAIRRLNRGDTLSAKSEIQKILDSIPSKPVAQNSQY